MTDIFARRKWGLMLQESSRWRHGGGRVLVSMAASLFVALLLITVICSVPDNPYLRWQLVDGTLFEPLRRSFERIHFDNTPVDVAIVGDSRTLLGLSAARIEERLLALGTQAHVANFSVPASGRNIQWAVLDELYKVKSARVIIIGVTDPPSLWGHPAFKFVAPAPAIAFPPAPLLHNYFYDLAYLPGRQARLLLADFFPSLFGLRRLFDPKIYAQTRSDFTSGSFVAEGYTVNMEAEVSEQTLLQKPLPSVAPARADRVLLRCCNDGDDHVYIRAIARIARAHGGTLIFLQVPAFNGPEQLRDRGFLSQYGRVMQAQDLGDFTHDSTLFESPAHLNHRGAAKLSDRIALAIASSQ